MLIGNAIQEVYLYPSNSGTPDHYKTYQSGTGVVAGGGTLSQISTGSFSIIKITMVAADTNAGGQVLIIVFDMGGSVLATLNEWCVDPNVADSGFKPIGLRAALGMATNDLDSQLDAILAASGGGGGDVTLAASQPNYAPAKAGDAMTLTGAYDSAKTAASAGAAMTLTGAYDSAKTAAAPGAAMTLTGAYDAAKTAAQVGSSMTISGPTIAAIAAAVSSSTVVTLTSAYDSAKTAAAPGAAMNLTPGAVQSIIVGIEGNVPQIPPVHAPSKFPFHN